MSSELERTFACGRSVCPITFGDTKEGAMGVRVNDLMTEKKGGQIENAAGKVGEKNCWGYQSPWCDYSGTIDGKVVRMTNFGAFVELDEGIEGLCHVSEIGEAERQDIENRFRLGEEAEFKIIKLSPGERKIGLSQKALAEDAERREYDSYRESADGSATLADLFHAKDNS